MILPNVKDEPRRELARAVPSREAMDSKTQSARLVTDPGVGSGALLGSGRSSITRGLEREVPLGAESATDSP